MGNKIFHSILLSTMLVLLCSISIFAGILLYHSEALPLTALLQSLLLILLLAAVFSLWLSRRMAKHILQPLKDIDLEHPQKKSPYPELEPLLQKMDGLSAQLSTQTQALQQKAAEFQQITFSMTEGLILLDKNGSILSINPMAKELYRQENPDLGQSFWKLDRSQAMQIALQNAIAYGSSVLRQHRNGREYRFELSRTPSGGSAAGLVILIIDVTEVIHAEHNRRQFTANVSHELKTPLQSIIGSAELLENKLVPPEEAPRFFGHIRREASRMVTLIEDILRLSQLDEGIEVPKEEVELLSLAQEVAAALENTARAKSVHVYVQGEAVTVLGVRRLLYEIIYNLCDNGIKYNRSGGNVRVLVSTWEGSPRLCVSDNGIGIPPEHHSRIFERFYRVDKSHSKQSGGTGLGLSIVKHAAAFHNARLELQSVPEKGTTITLSF